MSTDGYIKEEDQNLEVLKLVYEKASLKHNTYLSWREKLTGGYVAIIAALAIALWNIYEKKDMHFYMFIIFFATLIISFIFRELDARNAILYKASQTVALTIEKELKLCQNATDFKNTSLFYTLDNSARLHKKGIPHTALLRYVYNGMMLFSAYFLIYSILFYNLKWDPNIELRKYLNWVYIGFMWLIVALGVRSMFFSLKYFFNEIFNKTENAEVVYNSNSGDAELEIREINSLILEFKKNSEEVSIPNKLRNKIKEMVTKSHSN